VKLDEKESIDYSIAIKFWEEVKQLAEEKLRKLGKKEDDSHDGD
jgi:hypothetical protein